jgi:hypothetical protein
VHNTSLTKFNRESHHVFHLLSIHEIKPTAGREISIQQGYWLAAPFFGKIKPKVIDLRPGYCDVEIKDRWGVGNYVA